MGGKADRAKGQGKELVGRLTDDSELESEGKADVRAGETKEKVEHGKHKIEEAVETAAHEAEGAIDSVKDMVDKK